MELNLDNTKKITRRPGQRGVNLSERERSRAHHNAFQSGELKHLVKAIRKIHDPKAYHDLDGDLPDNFHEALIVGLALATGRSLNDTLNFSLLSSKSEYLSLGLYPGGDGKFYYPVWHRCLKHGVTLKIPLPEFLKPALRSLLRSKEGATLKECFPTGVSNWQNRCLLWINSLRLSTKSIDLKIRDELSRSLYQKSANEFLLVLLTTSTAETEVGSGSLRYYLNPKGKRVIKTYSEACRQIFGAYGAPPVTWEFNFSDTFLIRKEQHGALAQYFKDCLAQSSPAVDIIKYHNALARYLLMLLVIATGHRKSRTPFFFPWDLLDEEELVFICDKAVTGSEARFVPIPNWLSKMVSEYRRHLRRLVRLFENQKPGTSQAIARLVGDDRGKTHESPIGFFFVFDESTSPVTLSTWSLEQFYSPISNISINQFRRSIADHLWSQGSSGHQVEAFLGHNGKLHAFGTSSAWSIIDWAVKVRAIQDNYLKERGWGLVEIDVSKSIGSKLAIPAFQSTSYAYEGRSRSSGLSNAEEMLVKARLATKISEIIKHRHLTQSEAADIIGLSQPKLSGMLRGQFRGVSEFKMMGCLNKLGRDVEIVVRKTPRSHSIGKTSVVMLD